MDNIHAQAGLKPKNILQRLISILVTKSYVPNPGDPRKLALDLSHFEPNIDLATVARYVPKVELCIFRICGSYSVKDTMFPVFWPWAKSLSMRKSMYMYNWPGWTVDQHIKNFMDSVERYCDGDLGDGPIWVDSECHADKTKREVSNHTTGCVEAIKRETGKEVGVYSAQWFLEGYMEKQDWMQDCLWWWAQWVYEQGREHPGPPYLVYDIPEENLLWHQTGSACKAEIFGGTSYVDTDRWCLSNDRFNEIYNVVPEQPIPADWWPVYSELEGRVADVENRIGRHLQP